MRGLTSRPDDFRRRDAAADNLLSTEYPRGTPRRRRDPPRGYSAERSGRVRERPAETRDRFPAQVSKRRALAQRYAALAKAYAGDFSEAPDAADRRAFRASVLKSSEPLGFIPINCHAHVVGIERGDVRESHAIFTCGAFAAHALKFKQGGAEKLRRDYEARARKLRGAGPCLPPPPPPPEAGIELRDVRPGRAPSEQRSSFKSVYSDKGRASSKSSVGKSPRNTLIRLMTKKNNSDDCSEVDELDMWPAPNAAALPPDAKLCDLDDALQRRWDVVACQALGCVVRGPRPLHKLARDGKSAASGPRQHARASSPRRDRDRDEATASASSPRRDRDRDEATSSGRRCPPQATAIAVEFDRREARTKTPAFAVDAALKGTQSLEHGLAGVPANGLLVGFESLLSTQGAELHMLSDFRLAVDFLADCRVSLEEGDAWSCRSVSFQGPRGQACELVLSAPKRVLDALSPDRAEGDAAEMAVVPRPRRIFFTEKS